MEHYTTVYYPFGETSIDIDQIESIEMKENDDDYDNLIIITLKSGQSKKLIYGEDNYDKMRKVYDNLYQAAFDPDYEDDYFEDDEDDDFEDCRTLDKNGMPLIEW